MDSESIMTECGYANSCGTEWACFALQLLSRLSNASKKSSHSEYGHRHTCGWCDESPGRWAAPKGGAQYRNGRQEYIFLHALLSSLRLPFSSCWIWSWTKRKSLVRYIGSHRCASMYTRKHVCACVPLYLTMGLLFPSFLTHAYHFRAHSWCPTRSIYAGDGAAAGLSGECMRLSSVSEKNSMQSLTQRNKYVMHLAEKKFGCFSR